jgi:hypothetical protein
VGKCEKKGIENEEDVNNEEEERKEKVRVKRVNLCLHKGEERPKNASRENICVPSSVTGKISFVTGGRIF